MRDSKTYAKKIDKLIKNLKSKFPKTEQPTYDDPIDALVHAILSEEMSEPLADRAIKKIRKHFVDFNDLRVSRPEEIKDVLGNTEQIKNTSEALPTVLNAVFNRYDRVAFDDFGEMGKRQAKKELEELDGMTPFVCNYCFVVVLHGHAIPLNAVMLEYLRDEKLVHPNASDHDILGFLERHIPASNGWHFYTMLRSEAEETLIARKKASETKKARAKKNTTKKTAAKKTAKKEMKKTAEPKAAVKKKTATKKAAVKKTVAKKTAKAKKKVSKTKKK